MSNSYMLWIGPWQSLPAEAYGSPLTDARMKDRNSFVGWDFWGDATDGTGDHWFMPEGAYPVLVWQTDLTRMQSIPPVSGLSLDQAQAILLGSGLVPGGVRYEPHRTIPDDLATGTYPHSFAPASGVVDVVLSSGPYNWDVNPGDGTAGAPFQIGTAIELESLADHPELWDRCFVLTADIDMYVRVQPMALIAPDVNDSERGFQGTAFVGDFNGNGHRILSLQIDAVRAGTDYLGLFGMIGPGGQVRGLGLEDILVRGGTGPYPLNSNYVGSLAGSNAGSIVDCSATGRVMGLEYTGAIVGFNMGIVDKCSADVDVTPRRR